MNLQELWKRTRAVDRLKDASLELWQRRGSDIEDLEEMAMNAVRGAGLPNCELEAELCRAARALADLDYPDEDIKWFVAVAIYDFKEWEKERFQEFKERMLVRG